MRYDQKGQTVAVELTPDEKKKLEEDQRRFALQQASNRQEVVDPDLEEYRRRERYVNPITRVAGQETSSEKMRIMWISLQKMLT